MKTVLVSLFFAGLSSVAAADNSNICLTKLIALNGYSQLTASEANCMLADENVQAGVAMLCTPDLKEFSKQILIYSEYSKKFDVAWASYTKAPDAASKSQAIFAVEQIRREWWLFGFRDEVDTARGQLLPAEADCKLASK